MLIAALTAAVLLAAVVGLLVWVVRITTLPADRVHTDAQRNMDAIRCPLCHRPKVRGTDHGYGRCATSPAPPPPPVRRQLIEATYQRSAR